MLTDELKQTRNMLQHLQDSLVQDDRSQLEVMNYISSRGPKLPKILCEFSSNISRFQGKISAYISIF